MFTRMKELSAQYRATAIAPCRWSAATESAVRAEPGVVLRLGVRSLRQRPAAPRGNSANKYDTLHAKFVKSHPPPPEFDMMSVEFAKSAVFHLYYNTYLYFCQATL